MSTHATESRVLEVSNDQEKESEMTAQPHTLVVTETTVDGITERDYEIECPGVTDRCRAWSICNRPECTDAALSANSTAHGQDHQLWDESWWVSTTECCAVGHPQIPDAAEELNLAAGKHPVEVNFDDVYDLELDVLDAVPA